MKERLFNYLGIELYRVGHAERLVSAAGAFLGILAIFSISRLFLPDSSVFLIVASMGASAVLLFAVPHGPLSQPWALIGGHLVSAVVGVSIAKLIPDLYLASSVAVGLAVGAMYYLHCIHPPGGATALSAVLGGEAIQEIGYAYVITPVLLNVITIVIIAISFNFLFKWRRYPVYLARNQKAEKRSGDDAPASITHEDFVYALSEFDSYIDISEHDLLKIYDIVTQRHRLSGIRHEDLQHGHYYSNGEHGDAWSVRQIVDWAESDDDTDATGDTKLIYKIIAGENRRNSGVMSMKEFSRWARYEVYRDEGNWRKVEKADQESKR